ncbi:hypothetical protein DEU56DRAFT_761565 [Suillus clintonianus]|uniref:uncharacterized protein n=1 Tax=Suillus clintonianus TaxID=1904413 RepID=UPI001B86D36C|nr:uncharacterized protein DEU56DRAFT_761565 [Suillus clintonianus]KAG2116294.1 hypothetical protein DEU56DRAFT_761565 [Suillus clintonianus]
MYLIQRREEHYLLCVVIIQSCAHSGDVHHWNVCSTVAPDSNTRLPSPTGVYDTDDHSDSSIDKGSLIIRVRDDVAIFPLDERAVPLNDGSLPTMSYWYGKVRGIYLTTAKKTQDVWLDIQWYYRRVDLEDQDVEYVVTLGSFAETLKVSSSSLAACVGDYELVLSDHKSVVDMHCVEGNVLQLQEVNIEIRALMEQAMKLGKLPDGWMDDLQPTVDTSANEIIRRYSCPTCKGMVI